MISGMKKFLSYYKPYKSLLIVDLTCAIILSSITLILPLCARYIFKIVMEGELPNAIERIYTIGTVMLLLVAIHTLCNLFVTYQGHMMGALMERDIRNELFEHIQKLSFRFFDEQKTGQLMTRITNDSLSLTELYHHGPEDIIISLVKFLGSFIILMHIDLGLTLIVFIFLPIIGIYAFLFNERMNKAMRTSRERIGDINAQVEDSLAGIRVVQSFANEKIEKEKFAGANDRFVDSRKKVYRSEAFFYEGGLTPATQLVSIAVVIFGGARVINASLDIADLLTFVLCVSILIEPIQLLMNFSRLYQEGRTGFERIIEILETKPEIHDAHDAVVLDLVKGDIEFRNVSFKYREEYSYVLNSVSLNIKSGEFVALVGASGVGKTTLCSLIPRFYDAIFGEIRIDGIDVRDISLSSLRRNIGFVMQEVYLFFGTIFDNIRYGKAEADIEDVVEAAKKANAHDFIMEFPKGYDTEIGERGVKLSGGQKQRISIARVFLKNPPILIFDEATSSLDNESERAIRDALEKLAQNRTTIVIAHRLSTIRNAKRILVLSDKGIEEQGSHADLIKLEGVYTNLYKLQFKI